MAGPWEKYQAAPTGPWDKYAEIPSLEPQVVSPEDVTPSGAQEPSSLAESIRQTLLTPTPETPFDIRGGGPIVEQPADDNEHDLLYYKTGKTKSEREALNRPLREAMQVPAVSPETMSKVLHSALHTGLASPDDLQPPQAEPGPVEKSITDEAAKAISGMTTGEGASSLPLYMFPATAAGLTAENVQELPGQIGETVEKIKAGDYPGAASAGTRAALNALMIGGVMHGGAELTGGAAAAARTVLERRKGILARKAELEARAANGEQGLEPLQAAVNAELLDPANPVVHPPPVESPVRHGEFAKPGYTAVEPASEAPVQAQQPGDLWYQGVSADGVTQWVTHDPKIAADYAKRRGPDAKVNVYTAEQVGANAFADTEGNLMSPQEYAKNNWSTTIQQQGGPEGPRPKPIRTISIEEAEGPVQAPGAGAAPPDYTPEAAAARAAQPPPVPPEYGGPAPSAEPVPGIANRYIEEQIAAGTLPEEALVPGKGTTPRKAIANARAELARDPGMGFKAARRVTAGRMLPGDPARLHAYGDALAEASGQAGKAMVENPGNPQIAAAAKAAEGAHIDFLQNVLPKAKGMAQETLVGFQGAVPPDFATFTGMQKELLDFNGGKPLTRQQRMELYKRDQKGARLKTMENNGLNRMQTEMDRTMPRTRIPTREEMHASMQKFVERVTPCG